MTYTSVLGDRDPTMSLDEMIDDLRNIREQLESNAPLRLSIRERVADTPDVDLQTGLSVTARHFSVHAVQREEGLDGPIVLIYSGQHAADVM